MTRGPRRIRQWVTEGDLEAREHFVYRVYSKSGLLLYVGRTKHPVARWRQHRKAGAEWVQYASYCRMVGPLPYRDAHQLEARIIFAERPIYNVRGRQGTSDCRSVGASA